MPRQPFTPPFASTFNYRQSSNDWSGNLPKPVAESAYKGRWEVTTILEEPGKFRIEWTPHWPDYFEACTKIIEPEYDGDRIIVTVEIETELYRMDHSQTDLGDWLYEQALIAVGDDPEFDFRECSIEFNKSKSHAVVKLAGDQED